MMSPKAWRELRDRFYENEILPLKREFEERMAEQLTDVATTGSAYTEIRRGPDGLELRRVAPRDVIPMIEIKPLAHRAAVVLMAYYGLVIGFIVGLAIWLYG